HHPLGARRHQRRSPPDRLTGPARPAEHDGGTTGGTAGGTAGGTTGGTAGGTTVRPRRLPCGQPPGAVGAVRQFRTVNATSATPASPDTADPGRIVLLTTTHRVAPGLLSWPA